MDPDAVLQSIEIYPVNSSDKLPNEVSKSRSNVVYHFHELGSKLQNFWLALENVYMCSCVYIYMRVRLPESVYLSTSVSFSVCLFIYIYIYNHFIKEIDFK